MATFATTLEQLKSVPDQIKSAAGGVIESLGSSPLAGTAAIRAFGLTKIPVLWFVRPSVVETSDQRSVVKIPLRRRTANHLGVMYIGVLVAGADLAGGIMAMRFIKRSGANVHLLFKDLHVEFLKRVEGDAYFTCDEGEVIGQAVQRAVETGERVNQPMNIVATTPDVLGDEPVARFTLTLTLKRRS